eukprot:Skav233304  [mRNA]  locus=scaffold3742:106372:119257:- [translate_table: standard]
MKVRVCQLDMAPYADFAIFVNFQHRFSKTLKFLNHTLQPDGTFKAVEVPGPPNYDAWLSSWRVYENTLLMLEVATTAGTQPVASPASMEEYRDAFRDLVVNYPEAWHLLVVAEDRCRAEHFGRVRRRLEELHGKGLAPEFAPDRPWEHVFRTAARDRDYWDRHVREPALLFRTSGKHRSQTGGTGTSTDLTSGSHVPPPPVGPQRPARKKNQRQRLKQRVLTLTQEKKEWESKPAAAARDKSRPSKRDSRGRFLTDRAGKPICFAYNNGECKGDPHISAVPPKAKAPRRTPPEAQWGFQEFFAGFAGLTHAVKAACKSLVWVAAAHDTRFGDDLLDDEEYSRLVSRTGKDVPTWLHAACPPCRTFTRARRQDHHGTVPVLRTDERPEGFGDPDSEEGNLIADRTAAIGERQLEEGCFVSIENPVDSYLWEQKSFKRLAAKPGMKEVVLEQCAYGGGDGLKDGALAVAGERRISCCQVLCLEHLDIAANLKLELPFFANELLGAAHLHGPLGLNTILDFCQYLRSILEKAEQDSVCLTCSRRPGAVANSLLLLGVFLILDKGYRASEAANVMRIVDSSSPTIPTQELLFPTPFLEKPNFTSDSLMLADCLFGIEMAYCKEWLLMQPEDVFSLLLLGKGKEDEKPVPVHFWIAADPVTTVEDPTKRDVDLILDPTPWMDDDLLDGELSPPGESFIRAISEDNVSTKGRHVHKGLRVVQSSQHIHTLDEHGVPSDTPQHVYAARSHASGFPMPLPIMPMSTGGPLPTKAGTVAIWLWVAFGEEMYGTT